jgi:hypothetical protein
MLQQDGLLQLQVAPLTLAFTQRAPSRKRFADRGWQAEPGQSCEENAAQ